MKIDENQWKGFEKKINEKRERNFMRAYWEDKDRIYLPEKKTEAQHKAISKKSKGIDAMPMFKKIANEGHNPFSLVTHINGKRIK